VTIHPEEAARALSEVDLRQQHAVDAGVVPGWFWTAIAALVVIFYAGIESRQPVIVGVASVVFALGLGVTIALTVRSVPVQLHNDLRARPDRRRPVADAAAARRHDQPGREQPRMSGLA